MKPSNALLAAGLTAVAVVLTAPAVADATELWWFDHKQGRFPTTQLPKVDEPSLEGVYLTDNAGNEYGPCEKLKVKGTLFNKFGGMGEGTVTGIHESGFKECPVNGKTTCKVVKFEPLTKTQWELTLNTDSTVLITNFSITVELSGECEGLGLPTESTVTGTVEAKNTTFVPYSGSGGPEIKFNKAQVGTTGIYLDGEIGFGTFLTSLPEPKGFKAEESPAKLDGTALGSFFIGRESQATVIECEKSTFTGTAKDKDTTVTLTPKFEACKTELGPVTIDATGCTYVLHNEAKLVEGEIYTYVAPTDLKCEEGREIEIEVFVGEPEHEAENPACKYGIDSGGNEGLKTVELTQKMPDVEAGLEKAWIEADVEIEGITSQLTEGPMFVCGEEIENKGTLKGTYQVTGTTEDLEAPNGIALFPS